MSVERRVRKRLGEKEIAGSHFLQIEKVEGSSTVKADVWEHQTGYFKYILSAPIAEGIQIFVVG